MYSYKTDGKYNIPSSLKENSIVERITNSSMIGNGKTYIPDRTSDKSISSDCTPMLLLYTFLQEEPLISKSNRTGSKGELYNPYLQTKKDKEHYSNTKNLYKIIYRKRPNI